MEKLLNPDIGLMVWTVVTFVALAFVLARFAWKPILAALDAREDSLRQSAATADKAQKAAEALRLSYEAQLAGVEAKTRDLLAQAEAQARSLKEDLARTAHAQAQRILDDARAKWADEERRLLLDLRTEVAKVSLLATEKMLRRGLDKPFQDRLMQEAMGDFDKWAAPKP